MRRELLSSLYIWDNQDWKSFWNLSKLHQDLKGSVRPLQTDYVDPLTHVKQAVFFSLYSHRGPQITGKS